MSPAPLRATLVMNPVDQKFCMALGNVIVQWSYLERTYHNFIALLLERNGTTPPPDWRYQRPKQKAELFADEAKKRFSAFPRILSELDNIKAMMDAAQIDRNLLAHGEIATITPTPQTPIMRLRVRGRYNRVDYEREYPLKLLQDIYSSITAIHGRLDILLSDRLAADFDPGWSEQELLALRNFQANIPTNLANPDTPDTPHG